MFVPTSWQDIFTKEAGYTPESVGIKTPEAAHQHLLTLQAMKRVTPGGLLDPNGDWGRLGTTNETITPEKK